MDHQKQGQQTENLIIEMLEFLETSSEEEYDLENISIKRSHEETKNINKGFSDNSFLNEDIEKNIKVRGGTEKAKEPISHIAKELEKLEQHFQWNTREMAFKNKKEHNASTPLTSFGDSPNCKTNSGIINTTFHNETLRSDPVDWQYKLENHCRRSFSNSYIQEIYKAIYQDTDGHPPSGSADYYQAAQNYVLYGKNFLDFPENIQAVLNDKNSQNSLKTLVAENSNLITNFGNYLYPKPNTTISNTSSLSMNSGGLTTSAASAAAYYHICNSMQAQARPKLSTNPGNSTAYGLFLGNKVTYVAGTLPTTPLIYNQHNATTNFISNSLANAALASSPTMLYTNPMLTTTSQQYLTQFLSTAALTANSMQSSAVAPNANGTGVYERLIYAHMLQQHLYQTQQAAAIAAMFQHKQRVAVATAARQSNNVINSNRSSPQHITSVHTTTNTNVLTLNSCNRQASSSSSVELVGKKPQSPVPITATETLKILKSPSD